MKSKNFERIRKAVEAGNFVVSFHAQRRLRERRVTLWQIIGLLDSAVVLKDRPNDPRGPTVETRQELADGTNIKVVWSIVVLSDEAILVTVHFFD